MSLKDIFLEAYRRWPQHYVTGELGVPPDISLVQWRCHYIPFGILFACLALFIFLSIIGFIQDSREKKFMRRNHFLIVNVALFYFTLATAIPILADPREDRRFMRPRAVRQFVHLIIRLRLPCLTLAFSLVQFSLLNITEIRLYATRFHNIVLICTLNLIHYALIIISTVSSMFIANYALVWVLCDMYSALLVAGYALGSLYTGFKILRHYHRHLLKFLKVLSTDSSTCGDSNTDHHQDVENTAEKKGEFERDKEVNEKVNEAFAAEKIDLFVHEGDNNKKMMGKSPSLFPIYVDDHKDDRKIICEKRRIGSMPYQTHTSKFVDKSIRKVASLQVGVAFGGLLLCCGLVVALLSAAWYDGENVEGWRWLTLRTLLRLTELGMGGTLAYMVRRGNWCC